MARRVFVSWRGQSAVPTFDGYVAFLANIVGELYSGISSKPDLMDNTLSVVQDITDHHKMIAAGYVLLKRFKIYNPIVCRLPFCIVVLPS